MTSKDGASAAMNKNWEFHPWAIELWKTFHVGLEFLKPRTVLEDLVELLGTLVTPRWSFFRILRNTLRDPRCCRYLVLEKSYCRSHEHFGNGEQIECFGALRRLQGIEEVLVHSCKRRENLLHSQQMAPAYGKARDFGCSGRGSRQG